MQGNAVGLVKRMLGVICWTCGDETSLRAPGKGWAFRNGQWFPLFSAGSGFFSGKHGEGILPLSPKAQSVWKQAQPAPLTLH